MPFTEMEKYLEKGENSFIVHLIEVEELFDFRKAYAYIPKTKPSFFVAWVSFGRSEDDMWISADLYWNQTIHSYYNTSIQSVYLKRIGSTFITKVNDDSHFEYFLRGKEVELFRAQIRINTLITIPPLFFSEMEAYFRMDWMCVSNIGSGFGIYQNIPSKVMESTFLDYIFPETILRIIGNRSNLFFIDFIIDKLWSKGLLEWINNYFPKRIN